MTLYKWSQVAAADATADPSINWQEGQAPSSINDSARAMMAAMAKYRDDVAGSIVTGGTSTAYTVSSFQVFDTLGRLHGQTIAFTPHATNGAAVTLSVDGLGAKPLRSAPGVDLLPGMLVQGTPYTCTYSNSDAAFYLRDFFVSPYSVPLGSCIDYFGTSAPNSAFALAYGQAISRVTYAPLFALFGTTYGSGDGAGTFNLPDLRGRVLAGKDDMGGAAASRLTPFFFGGTATSLGAIGGLESHTLTTAQLAPHSHANTLTDPGHYHEAMNISDGSGGLNDLTVGTGYHSPNSRTTAKTTGITIANASTGGGNAHNNVQPTIISNKLIRVL
jgi:microcystin-dependent protein